MRPGIRATRFIGAIAALIAALSVAPVRGQGFDLNHYILGCANVCASISDPATIGTIDATFTGTWYDPAQNGQGLSLEVLPNNRVLVFWFTFNPDGTQQAWLVGTGTYSGNVATVDAVDMPTGGRWIPNFDATRIIDNAWGTMTLTFDDSNHGKVDFTSMLGYGSGSMNLVRLTRPAGITSTALSASGRAWVPTGNLMTPRGGHTATLLGDGRVLVAGGQTADSILASAEIYDPVTGSWTSTGSMTRPRNGHTATTLPDGRVLVVGGDAVSVSQYQFVLLGTAELYDPATGRWSSTGSLNTPRVAFTATLLSAGKVLVAGGVDNDGDTLKSAELYDPASGTWSYTGSLGHAREFHTATALANGNVLVTGGWDDDLQQTTTATAELYDPVAGTWSTTAPLHGSRVFHTATVLQNGNVLIAGGYNSAPPSGEGVYVPRSFSDAQIYDTSTGTWTDVGSLNIARDGHSATGLPDGKVLVAGGYNSNEQMIVPNAEVFDPATGTWSDGGSFYGALAGRTWSDGGNSYAELAGSTATLLQNGNVLLAGGTGSVTAEVYENVPITGGEGMTGTWYDPAQSGHGLVIEALPGNQMLAEWFAFNPGGTQQSWFLGVGSVSGNTATIAAVDQPTGGRFIPNFDASKIANNAWGTLKLTFTDCDHGKVDFASTAGYGSGSMNLTRLTQPAGVTCP